MGLRSLIRGIAVLCVVAVVLFIVSVLSEIAFRARRSAESTFVALVANEALQAKDITKVEVVLPEELIRWEYKRIDGFWRLPDFAGVFALNGEVDNVVKMLLQGRARPVGEMPADEARFGLLPNSALKLTLFQDSTELLGIKVGALAPGAAKDERYVVVGADETIYLLNSNPGTFFLEGEPPTMVDTHILPRALPRGMPARISFAGSRVSDLREMVIKQLPVDTKKQREDIGNEKKNKKNEPTHEFIGTLMSGATKMFDDADGMMYVNKTVDIEFDKIVGSISPVQVEYRKFDDPIIEVTLHYDNAPSISLAVSGSLIDGKNPILNRSTGQMFVIDSEKVDALIPNLKAKPPTAK